VPAVADTFPSTRLPRLEWRREPNPLRYRLLTCSPVHSPQLAILNAWPKTGCRTTAAIPDAWLQSRLQDKSLVQILLADEATCGSGGRLAPAIISSTGGEATNWT
jgi:hypothetical protein